jgi:hypothetical protein
VATNLVVGLLRVNFEQLGFNFGEALVNVRQLLVARLPFILTFRDLLFIRSKPGYLWPILSPFAGLIP